MTLYQWKQETKKFALVQDGKILNHLAWPQWQKIHENDVLLWIEKMNYSTAAAAATVTVTVTRALATAAVTREAAMATVRTQPIRAAAMADYDEFDKYWNANKSVPGAVFLAPNGKLIYVSCIDMKYMEKVNATRS